MPSFELLCPGRFVLTLIEEKQREKERERERRCVSEPIQLIWDFSPSYETVRWNDLLQLVGLIWERMSSLVCLSAYLSALPYLLRLGAGVLGFGPGVPKGFIFFFFFFTVLKGFTDGCGSVNFTFEVILLIFSGWMRDPRSMTTRLCVCVSHSLSQSLSICVCFAKLPIQLFRLISYYPSSLTERFELIVLVVYDTHCLPEVFTLVFVFFYCLTGVS